MKRLCFLLVPILILSCKDDDFVTSPELIGTWELKEVFVGGGIRLNEDGTQFNPVESDKTIVFDFSGKVSSNGSLCDLFQPGESSGTYTLKDSTITAHCTSSSSLKFQLTKETLIVYYSCFEGCAEKYVKQ